MSAPRLIHDVYAVAIDKLHANLRMIAASLALLAIAGLIGVIGISFLLTGAYQSLTEVLVPWEAGGIVAIVAVVTALAMIRLTRWLLFSRRRRGSIARSISQTAGEPHTASDLGIDAAQRLSRDMRPVDLALAAFIAGLLVSTNSSRDSKRSPSGRHRR